MKKTINWLFGPAIAAVVVLTAAFGAFAQPAGTRTKPKPHAVYEDSRVEADVEENGEKGVRVYVSFAVYQMRNLIGQVAVRVYNGDDVLMDGDGSYKNADGEVVASREIKPGFEPADYKDFAIFLPYSQLELDDGQYSLRLDIDLNYRDGKLIQHLAWEDLEYTQGENADMEDSKAGTKVNKIWIDYNVKRNEKVGMLVHVNFEVAGMKGVDSALVIRIRKDGETYLESANAGFSNSEGQFEVTYSIKPGYDQAVYEDATIFIPYNEIIIARGTWNLELDVDLAYENGDLIQHLDFFEFQFNRR